jgi:hypothetical protein
MSNGAPDERKWRRRELFLHRLLLMFRPEALGLLSGRVLT